MISIIGLVIACLVILGAIGIMIYDEKFLEDVCDECGETSNLKQYGKYMFCDSCAIHYGYKTM